MRRGEPGGRGGGGETQKSEREEQEKGKTGGRREMEGGLEGDSKVG